MNSPSSGGPGDGRGPWDPLWAWHGSRQWLAELEAAAEKSYAAMYDAPSPTAAYADAKDTFGEAILVARKLGLDDDVARLEARLAHVKAVFRSQFAGG